MKTLTLVLSFVMVGGAALADDVRNIDKILCSQSQVLVCLHGADCLSVEPERVQTPQFVIVDTRRKIVSTTRASGDDRSSEITLLIREGGLIMAQGHEHERVFSFVIDEATGTLTGSTASDGYTISSFGACTRAKVE